jgi:phenylacetate-CoA ligase
MNDPFTDAERFPLLTDAGRRMLQRLREHPHAPVYNYRCGERLTAPALARVRAYAAALGTGRVGWRFGEVPEWVGEFVARCRREVPFYRDHLAGRGDDFFALPLTERGHLRRLPWAFVPLSADLNELVVYTTSGTTGERLRLPAHPENPNRYLPLIQTALAAFGVTLEGGDRVSIVQVGYQTRTFTLPSVMSYLDFAGFAKVNLNPADWRAPDDRVYFLDDLRPEIYTGDPIAFAELARLPLRTRPKGLVSAATALRPGLRQRLEAHFGCPVVDVYSMNESGPVAFARGDAHEVLPHDLYVETLDADGRPCPPGVRGEVTLTGGCNPYLPLVRYRTGDFAALDFAGPLPRLVGLEGRPPVVFRAADGRRFNSIDVTIALRELPLPFLELRQAADGPLRFRTRGDTATLAAAEAALRGVFGGLPLTVEAVPDGATWEGKLIQYGSELEP